MEIALSPRPRALALVLTLTIKNGGLHHTSSWLRLFSVAQRGLRAYSCLLSGTNEQTG